MFRLCSFISKSQFIPYWSLRTNCANSSFLGKVIINRLRTFLGSTILSTTTFKTYCPALSAFDIFFFYLPLQISFIVAPLTQSRDFSSRLVFSAKDNSTYPISIGHIAATLTRSYKDFASLIEAQQSRLVLFGTSR